MDLDVDINIDILETNSPFVSYKIPIVSYLLKEYNNINNTLITIIDNIEKFYINTKYNTINDGDGKTNTKSILTHNYKNFNIFDHTEYESINILKNFVSNSYEHYITNFIPESSFNLDVYKNNNKYKNSIGINCWGNKLGRYDYLDKHTHRYSLDNLLPAGNYFVKSPGHETYTKYYHPLTIFKNQSHILPNTEGALTLFPNFIYHMTSPNRSSNSYRYTLGMDCYIRDVAREREKCVVSLFD